MVRLRQAVGGGAHPHRIELFESLRNIKKADTRMGICFFGTPEGTRTPDLLVRSQSLYPTELPARITLSSARVL